ncbi:DUF934 domain-containing protein [Pseudomonas hormoni]|uniref:DUF934 domain-containing protein n=1 Tax=Pseudomonas hormoni TaxID=3093767 RepID=UPI0035CB7D59
MRTPCTYRYDEYDRALVRERAAQFRDQVERRIAGQLSEEEFLPLRLQSGLYLQKHAYMLRVATPYLLRTRLGWRGELRAVGDALRDQLAHMRQCGFDAFAVRADNSLEDALKGLAGLSVLYGRSAI